MTIIPFGTTAVVKRHTPASTIVEVITGLRPNLFSISGCKRDKGIIRNVGKMKETCVLLHVMMMACHGGS